eukprot:2892470-Prymnesium_polylepis.2
MPLTLRPTAATIAPACLAAELLPHLLRKKFLDRPLIAAAKLLACKHRAEIGASRQRQRCLVVDTRIHRGEVAVHEVLDDYPAVCDDMHATLQEELLRDPCLDRILWDAAEEVVLHEMNHLGLRPVALCPAEPLDMGRNAQEEQRVAAVAHL